MAKYVGFNRGRNFDSCIKPILILNQSTSILSLNDFELLNTNFESMVEKDPSNNGVQTLHQFFESNF